eukprot:TRINITY_DN781_c0_g5_i2.p1 TRINITY_DN781_c0_g5~~TRINITY_DN781_c0_g5_i2.p1  ORF type:complete len:155 (+),score=25.85 TRINITY_DN781_c0_g5_i2:340-804(+)
MCETGKSSMVSHFLDNGFVEQYIPTVALDCKPKYLNVEGLKVKLLIVDTSGLEPFNIKGAQAVVVVYDISNRASFINTSQYINEIDKRTSKNVIRILVGNKCDKASERQVSYTEGQNLAMSSNMLFYETSAKDASYVDSMFMNTSRALVLSQFE